MKKRIIKLSLVGIFVVSLGLTTFLEFQTANAKLVVPCKARKSQTCSFDEGGLTLKLSNAIKDQV